MKDMVKAWYQRAHTFNGITVSLLSLFGLNGYPPASNDLVSGSLAPLH